MKSISFSKILKASAYSLLMISLANCGATKTKAKAEEAKKAEVGVLQKMSASDLVDTAEQLVTPYQFMKADGLIDLALEKDPKNLKAQFYKKYLARYMLLKGVLKGAQDLDSVKSDVIELQNKIISDDQKDFLNSGDLKYNDEGAGKSLLWGYLSKLSELNQFLNEHNDKELNIKSNVNFSGLKVGEVIKEKCDIPKEKVEEKVACGSREEIRQKVVSGDLKNLRQKIAGEVLVLNLFTGFSTEDLMKKIGDNKNALSVNEILDLLKKESVDKKDNKVLKMFEPTVVDVTTLGPVSVEFQKSVCNHMTVEDQDAQSLVAIKAACTGEKNDNVSDMKIVLGLINKDLVSVETSNLIIAPKAK